MKTIKADFSYQQPSADQPFWIPDAVSRVAGFFHWGIAYVEQHPDGSIIVTFSSVEGPPRQEAGHIWEMSIEVVRDIDRRLPAPRSAFGGLSLDWW